TVHVGSLQSGERISTRLSGVSGSPEMQPLIYAGSDENDRRHYQSASEQRQLTRIHGEPAGVVVSLIALLFCCCCAGATGLAFNAGFSAFAAREPFMGLLLFTEGVLIFIGGA